MTSAEITLWLKDDGLDMKERARLKLGINKFSWEVDNGKVSFTLESLITLSDTGKIIAILIAKKGDFYFGQASLFATATDPSPIVPQPEPATILLMGSGILGLVIYGRKRYIKKA